MRYPDRLFDGKSLAGHAWQEVAICHESLGQLDDAATAYRRALDAAPQGLSAAGIYRELGRLAAAEDRFEEAIEAYRQAADSADVPRRTMVEIPDVARRDMQRVERDRTWVRPLDMLAAELASALRTRDVELLGSLASPTHFTFGLVGGERRFVDPAPFLDQLGSDLAVSTVEMNPAVLGGQGGKRYLETRGWDGEYFSGSVPFLITAAPGGYEWGGVALMQRRRRNGGPEGVPDEPPEEPPELPDTPPAGQETPASLGMKAPWPAGENFRAGGIVGFVAQVAGFAATTAPLGPAGPAAYAILLEVASLATPCGFGPGGLYYGQPTTHVDRDTFAIDFSRFVQGVPLLLDAGNKPVLAVADGYVTDVRGNVPSGDPVVENRVDIRHITAARVIEILIAMLTGQSYTPPKYSTEYLHLAGPAMVPVSLGMFVRQGARLGRVDDTGLSVADHLHFSLHDRDLPTTADSVRPTPMDGQTLNDGDDGRCMFSTNVAIP